MGTIQLNDKMGNLDSTNGDPKSVWYRLCLTSSKKWGEGGGSLVTLILRNLLTAQHLDNVLSSIFEKKVTLNIKKKTKK